MKRLPLLILLTILAATYILAQDNSCPVEINGYTQVRMETDWQSNPNFYIRRARIWIDGKLPYQGKGQFVYRTKFYFTKGDKYPRLMDAKIGYKYKNFVFWAGQQVPDFGRQIMQGDSKIPLGERAKYNYYLSPGEEGLLRDIGVQAFYKFDGRGHISAGYFNGYFANNFLKHNPNFMITHRFTYDVYVKGQNFVALGYSVMYRKAKDLTLPKLIPDTLTGTDFRYELEFEARFGNTNVEAGFCRAYINNQNTKVLHKAEGYYIHLNQYFTPKNIGILAVDYLSLPADQCSTTPVTPWYVVGYTHLFNGNKVKLSLNQWIKYENNVFDTFTRVQLQIYLK